MKRDVKNKLIAGVCAGIANYLNVDAAVIRLAYILATLFTGIMPGLIIYMILWIIMPPGE